MTHTFTLATWLLLLIPLPAIIVATFASYVFDVRRNKWR